MLKKTSLMFREDVKKGYKNYRYFKIYWSGVTEAFKKYICPVPVNINIDCNNNWITLQLLHDHPDDDWLETEWEELIKFLDEERFMYNTEKNKWMIIITMDEFVETILCKPELYEW